MRKFLLKSLLTATILATMGTSCTEDVSFEGGLQPEPNSTLTIRTRVDDGIKGADGEASKVSYPVYVYVFDSSGKCSKRVQVAEEAASLSIDLIEGKYSVFAIAGADAGNYSLPSEAEARPESVVSLTGESHGDLMSASSTVSLVEGGENTLTLTMQRKVMKIESIVINNVPSTATGVSVTIAPLYSSVCINGTYSDNGASEVLPLAKDGSTKTWKTSAGRYVLPPSTENATISVNITGKDGKVKSYSYTSSQELVANYKINIVGTYTERLGVSLAGTIVGATWSGEREIKFDFDERGSTGTVVPEDPVDDSDEKEPDVPIVPTGAPEKGTIYKDKYYVLDSKTSGGTTTVTLVSTDEVDGLNVKQIAQEAAEELVNAAIAKMTEGSDISGWRIPTKDEMDVIYAEFGTINKVLLKGKFVLFGTGENYFVKDNGKLVCYVFSSSGYTSPTIDGSTLLRAVTTVTFK